MRPAACAGPCAPAEPAQAPVQETTPDPGDGAPVAAAGRPLGWRIASPALVADGSGRLEAIRQLHGPLLEESHERSAQLDHQMLRCIYKRVPVDSEELLVHMLRRHLDLAAQPPLVEVCARLPLARLAGDLIRDQGLDPGLLPEAVQVQLLQEPALAGAILRSHPHLFSRLPRTIRSVSWLRRLLPTMTAFCRDRLLSDIADGHPRLIRLLETPEQRVRRNPREIESMALAEVTPRLRQLAVEQDFRMLRRLKPDVDAREYGALCDRALETSGVALEYIDRDLRTEARVLRALAHKHPPHISAIPRSCMTGERLRAVLARSSYTEYWIGSRKLASAFLDEWQLWDTLRRQPGWLEFLPAGERTEALCAQYIAQFPMEAFGVTLPTAVRDRHPEWTADIWPGAGYLPLCLHGRIPWERSEQAVRQFVDRSGARLGLVPSAWKGRMPAWSALLDCPGGQQAHLAEHDIDRVLARGDTGGLAAAFRVPALAVEAAALLDPVQEEHCSLRAAWLPAQVRRQLMFCAAFQPRRQQEGWALRRQMDQHSWALAAQMVDQTLPAWQPVTGACWRLQGGRTLVREENGRCVHMKFQRHGETLRNFAAEEAVQRFAHRHCDYGWYSELPEPEGIYRVALQDLPVAAEAFGDRLARHEDQAGGYRLAFRFTTRDHSYDTLAFEVDAEGGRERAREGLLRGLHDLGIWSSLGAVHTSTIQLYHQFQSGNRRPELLLAAFFSPGADYPGRIHLWNTEAIEQSDWGWSGLRDLGDLEFYPFIATYMEAVDAQWVLPGYGQRASFVNGLAQNILAALLHYMRLYRSHPDYHYSNGQQVAALADFIERGCDTLLDGLLGDGTRLKDLLPQDSDGVALCERWCEKTAEEILYWTAVQEPGGDCFSEHLDRTGRPSERLYPGHPWLDLDYEEHFADHEGDNLGAHGGKLPLFYLVRGLYMLAAGVADRLAPAEDNSWLSLLRHCRLQ